MIIPIIIIVIILILYFIFRKDTENFSQTTCMCVFDLDGTLTCGEESAKIAVHECKKRMCKFAINTARYFTTKNSDTNQNADKINKLLILDDIKLDRIGLTHEDIYEDIYTGFDPTSSLNTYTPFLNSLSSRKHFVSDLINQISLTKVDHMHTIKNKYNIDPKRIILFDDVLENINSVKNHGFSAVHANGICGLNQNVKSDISKILD